MWHLHKYHTLSKVWTCDARNYYTTQQSSCESGYDTTSGKVFTIQQKKLTKTLFFRCQINGYAVVFEVVLPSGSTPA